MRLEPGAELCASLRSEKGDGTQLEAPSAEYNTSASQGTEDLSVEEQWCSGTLVEALVQAHRLTADGPKGRIQKNKWCIEDM